MVEKRVSVKEAAVLLGTTEHAIRQRIYRGTLDSEKVEGKVYVQLTGAELHGASRETHSDAREMHGEMHYRDELVEELRATNEFLRQQLEAEREARRRADTIIAQLSQANATLARRVPELEAPRKPRGSSVSDEEGPPYGTSPKEAEESLHHVPYDTSPQEAEESSPRAPWWRRWF